MASVNKVILVGNLGRDPECRSFSNGDRVANVSLATTERWRDKQSSEMRELTEWHRLVFHGRLVDIVEQYLRKGSLIYIEGSLRTRKWTDKDGQERYTTEIRVDQMKMLGGRNGDVGEDDGQGYPRNAGIPGSTGGRSRPSSEEMAPPPPPTNFDDMDDDIPF